MRARAAGLLLAVALAACGREASGPNLLLVTFDTTRFDATTLGPAGRDTTPHLAQLAAEGVAVEQAYAPSATTAPSHASLFTSLLPPEHGVVKNGLPLPEELPLLAETLEDAGWETAAFVSSYVLASHFGWSRGFDRFDDAFSAETSSMKTRRWEGWEIEDGFDRPADETTRRAIAWLRERDGSRPFFLFVHYFDPHNPYEPPEAWAARFPPRGDDALARARAAYEAEIAFTDHQLGRLVAALDARGLREETLVVVTADHGEGLMDHGHMHHGVHLYEEQVRVPLVFRWPGHLASGRRLEGPVSLVDVAPTVLALLGRPPLARHEGTSLAEALRGGAEPAGARPVRLYRRHYADDHETTAGETVRGPGYGVRLRR